MNHPDSTTEIELKLAARPEALRALSAHRLLKGRTRPVARRLYSVYFDTPDLDLWQKGLTLRVRRDGRRWVQTVKGGGTAQAGLHQRLEIETEVPGPVPDCARVTAGGVADIFASPDLRAQLKPVFVTDFRRSSRIIELNEGTLVEASIDRGEIKSGDRTEPVNELELELKSGPAWRLFEFALSLVGVAPAALENRSKAERGYALYRAERPAPAKARAVALSADMTVNDAFKAIAWTTLNHMQSNERGMQAGGEPEYLHQMRVALRRLRSAFGVFSAVLPEPGVAPIVAELKWLASRLGPARDWDVFVTETLPPIRATFAQHAALAQFGRECAQAQRGANRKARRAVASGRYQRLILSLAGQLSADRWSGQMNLSALVTSQAPVTEFAAVVLDRRYARVRKRGRKLDTLEALELHRLRIAIKKFRYAVEFFASLFEPKQARDLRARLAKLQDILGAMNDAAAVARLLEGAFGAKADQAVSEARGILLGWSHGRALTLKRELRVAWKAFRASEKFW